MRSMLLPVVMMLALASGGHGPARGQTSSSSLTGSGLVVATLPGSTTPGASILLTCHPDGTATAMLPGFGDSAGAGSWASVGDGQFALTTLHYDQNPPPDPMPVIGFFKLRYSVNVSGRAMTGTAEAIQTDVTGAVQDHITGITLTATPISVEQIGAP